MLNISAIALDLSERLQPLRDGLGVANIGVAYLPQSPGSYSDDNDQGYIDIVIPGVIGAPPQFTLEIARVEYAILVKICLPKLYKIDKILDIGVVEYCVDVICNLLVNYEPLGITPGIAFKSYQLSPPDNNRWMAEIRLGLSALVQPISPLSTNELVELIGIQIYNSDLNNDHTLVKRYP